MLKRVFRIIGPGLITASVVLGPGSIVSASDVGAKFGTSLLWLLVVAMVCMATYVGMSARIGCLSERTVLRLAAERHGSWLAVLLGISSFLVAAAFQFGNNLGVATAVSEITHAPLAIWPIGFTGLSILFLFWARDLYAFLERFLTVLVGVMILAFFANLVVAGFDIAEVGKGLVPQRPEGGFSSGRALVATSFSVIAALYQAYLVRSKGWRIDDYPTVVRDARSGITILGLITAVIVITSAGAFAGKGITIGSAGDLANQLEALFGPAAHVIFCIGLGAAAFSSFIVNALIGGALLCDGLGWDPSMDGRPAKCAASVVLLVGMSVALAVLFADINVVQSIVVGQMSTLLAVPLAAVVLVSIANSRAVMGEFRNGIVTNLIAATGLLLILWLWFETASGLIARLG